MVKKKNEEREISLQSKDKFFDDDVQLTWYTKEDIVSLRDEIKTWWILFEAELIKELSKSKMLDWSNFDAKAIVDFYLDMAQNSMKVNSKTWDLVEDNESRLKAMDKLLKIITWNSWTSQKVSININNTTNNLWNNIPPKWEKLLY